MGSRTSPRGMRQNHDILVPFKRQIFGPEIDFAFISVLGE